MDQEFTDSDSTEELQEGVYTFAQTVEIGENYVQSYNAGVEFKMENPVLVVDTEDKVNGGFFSGWPSLKLGLGIGGGALLIAGVVAAILLCRRR